MSGADGTEFRMYLVVTDISFRDPKVRQRFEYTWEDEQRLGWRPPEVRVKRQLAWLREQGADLKGARVMRVSDRLTPEAWEDEEQWWKFARKSCVWVDRPRRGRPTAESDIDEMQRMELRSEAFARGGMTGWNEYC